jgi:ABC-type transport system substrate-binding protein
MEIVYALQRDPTFASRGDAEWTNGRIVLSLREPNARFDLFLTLCGLVFRETSDGLIGTGPYRLDGSPSGSFVRLVANPHAPTKPQIETIEVRHYPVGATGRPETLLQALEKGEVDLAPRLSWRDIQGLKSTAAIMRPVNSTCCLYINCERFPDPRVRRAMAIGIDRQEVAQVAFGDNPLAFRATGLLPPALGKTFDGLAPDPTKARALLTDAGASGTALKLSYSPGARPYLPVPALVARHLRDRLRRVGFNVELEELSAAGALTGNLNTGEFDVALMGNIPDSPDPADFVATMLSRDAIPNTRDGTSFCFNFPRYRSETLDAYVASYRRDQNPETLSAVGRLVGVEAPLVPLLYGRACVAHSWRLKGWEASVTGLANLARLSFRV